MCITDYSLIYIYSYPFLSDDISHGFLVYKMPLNTQLLQQSLACKKHNRIRSKNKNRKISKERAMKFYHSLCALFLLIFIATITKNNKQILKLSSEIAHKKYTIFFELTNVLIKENQIGFSKKVGYGNLASYTITHWKNPGHRCLDMLATMSTHDNQQPHLTITLNKKRLPLSLVKLHEGKISSSQAKKEIMKSIEHLDTTNYFSSDKEKKLMCTIMDIVLNPEITATLIEQIKPTIQLAQKLKSAGHSIYIFANAPDELYTTLQKKYPDMLNLFDGVIISSQIKRAKPDSASFDHVMKTYNCNPQDCILIDSTEENIAAARELGMEAILFDKASQTTSRLKKLGVKL